MMESFLREWGVTNNMKIRWQAEGKAMLRTPIGIYPKGGESGIYKFFGTRSVAASSRSVVGSSRRDHVANGRPGRYSARPYDS